MQCILTCVSRLAALAQIEDVAADVNESIRRRENSTKLNELHNLVQGGSIVKSGRVRLDIDLSVASCPRHVHV